MFHPGWFVGKGCSVHAWNQLWSGTIGTDWMEADLYIDVDRALERTCFDYITAPGSQRRPMICLVGGSPAGIAFAAKHADKL
jgi:alkanesulfonate monooxygenase SsuD/methylene tetrahydromethanopterin reductase-like flavin-dependent oxidoreductase (luciferase family)